MGKRLGGVLMTGTDTAVITASPVLTSSTDDSYVANDYVGTSTTPIEFAGCASGLSGSGWVISCLLIDNAIQSVAGELWLFDAAITTPADSAAWTASDADAAKCIGVIPFSTYYASVANSNSLGIPAIPLFFKCATGSTSLFGAFVTRGAPNYDIDSLTFRLSILQD